MLQATVTSRRALMNGVAAATFAGISIRFRASAAQFSWKYGSALNAEHPVNVRLVEAFGKIRQETGGQVDIKAFLNSALGGDSAMVNQVREGALEMMDETGGLLDGFSPVAAIENLAYAFPTRQAAYAAMDGDLGALIRNDLASKGLIALERIYENGYRQFTTGTRPIRTAADLEGLRLRVSPGKLRVDTFRSMGAAPTPIDAAGLYTALQTHIVDGQETPLIFIENLKYYEVQKYCSLSQHVWSGLWVLINREKWNGMPPNLQEIVRKHCNAGAILQRRDNANLEASVHDKLGRQGLEFNDVAVETIKAKLRGSGYYARWRAEFGENAWKALEKYAGAVG